jgi:SAM-dependent methyltransferase
MYKKRKFLRFLLDRLSFPILVFLSSEASRKLGLTPIDEERTYACLKHSAGKTLDIGCGSGGFIQAYKNGYGIDKVFINNSRFILGEAEKIPFKDKTFDTITFIASLNHVVGRGPALKEAARVLKDKGQILITMINPFLGFLAHKIIRKRCDPDQIKRKIEECELFGLAESQIKILVSCASLKIVSKKSILLYGNKLYICEKDR